jgi:hypothetical protein
MRNLAKRKFETGEAFLDCRSRINVKRSSDALGELLQRDFVALQHRARRTSAKKSLSQFAIRKGRGTALTPV